MALLAAAAALLAAGQPVPRTDALPDAPAVTSPPRTAAPPLAMVKIVLVGDSTVAPVSGWGGAFCARHVAPTVACLNLARGGRSTRSYREEGSWQAAIAEAAVPGYARTFVLIQFGHNDGNPRMRVRTALDPEFADNLRRFVDEVRAAGAVPVLVTPMVRRLFAGEGLHNSLAPWADRMRLVARERDVPLVDLNGLSAALAGDLGARGAAVLAQSASPDPLPDSAARFRFAARPDVTHLGDHGARTIAAVLAPALATAVPELAPFLAP